jgi:predicted amidophosphoribosyltransferase
VKALSLEQKWAALGAAGLEAKRRLVAGKRVILLDDKYQSGTTAQFAAARLQEAGAQAVLGLACVKTWRDTDNK